MIYFTGNNSKMVESKPPHQMVVFIKCHTGYCGSDSSDLLLVDADHDVSEIAHEMAQENAQSHGYEGDYVCPYCGSNTEGEDCEDCGVRSEWEENESVSGYAEQFILSKHTGLLGGFDWGMIWQVLLEANALTIVTDSNNEQTYNIDRSRLFGETGLFWDRGEPEKEWAEFVRDVTHSGYKVVGFYPAT